MNQTLKRTNAGNEIHTDLQPITLPDGREVMWIGRNTKQVWQHLCRGTEEAARWDGVGSTIAVSSVNHPGVWTWCRIMVTGRTVMRLSGGAAAVRARVEFCYSLDGGTWNGFLSVAGGGLETADLAILPTLLRDRL